MTLFAFREGTNYVFAEAPKDLDIASSGHFESFLASVADSAGSRSIIVDLTGCRFIDSTGLTVLVRRQLASPRLIVVLPRHHTLQRVMTLTNMDQVLTLVDSREEAFARVPGPEE